jgi:hypothetical protein
MSASDTERALLCGKLLSGTAITWSLAARANLQTLTQPESSETYRGIHSSVSESGIYCSLNANVRYHSIDFVAFSAQNGGKLCERPDFMKPFQISQVKNGAIGRPDHAGTE